MSQDEELAQIKSQNNFLVRFAIAKIAHQVGKLALIPWRKQFGWGINRKMVMLFALMPLKGIIICISTLNDSGNAIFALKLDEENFLEAS